MSICRYDHDHGHLLRAHWPTCTGIGCPGCLPCTHNEDGAEVRHCTHSRGDGPTEWRCTSHLHADQDRTCSRCIGRVRADLTAVEQLAALMPSEATAQGINSEALSLAGPAADPHAFEARRVIANRAAWTVYETTGDWEKFARAYAAIPEWDRRHPVGLMRYWDMTLRKAYDQPTKLRHTLSRLIAFANSVLDQFAQDGDQDFALFAAEVAACRRHLEAVRRDSGRPQRGAPCWLCEPLDQCPRDCEEDHAHDYAGRQPALQLRRGHWCEDEACTKKHGPCEPTCELAHEHDYGDRWVCPRDPKNHWWSDSDYRKGVAADAKTERKHA